MKISIKSFYQKISSLLIILFVAIFCILNSGCANKTDDSPVGDANLSDPGINTGVFLDSPVEGLEFLTKTVSGFTDSNGTFHYKKNETVTFFIGSVILGQSPGKRIITPIDLVPGAADETDLRVVNICILLISLDEDGDPDNGIKISEEISGQLVGITLDFNDPEFASSINIQDLFGTLNFLGLFTNNFPRILIDSSEAITHLQETLSGITVVPPDGAGELGELWDLITENYGPDSDGDFIPDDIEENILGTDPYDRDTDRDGIYDYNEFFGTGVFDRNGSLPDADMDGIIAALDPDDNGDGENDGAQIDTDNDGIANYLEYYGYTYNWMSGQFMLWDESDVKNNPNVTYYKTDPLQPSTDQDPYSDSMEVSGAYMDVSVESPGSFPMVPAYPDIVIKLEGYAVTMNEDVSTSSGKSISKGESWDSATEATYSHTDETNWEMGTEISAEVSASLTDFGGSVSTSFHANYGGSESDTYARGVTRSKGGSTLTAEDWSTARSLNPTDAARIKLFLKVYNYGTASASNIIPTFTLRIGGRNIATFEQGNAQVNLLEPGKVYPEQDDIFWVIDSIDTGAGVDPISLTMDELRALESGAPVSITATQLAADVLKLNNNGIWEKAGDWTSYMARFDSVCSKLFIDTGDGNLITYMVYSDDAPSSPKVTLRDAVIWAAGGYADGAEQKIKYIDRVNGGISEKSMDGWSIHMDGETWEANRTLWDKDGDGEIDTEFNIMDSRLGPKSIITVKLPHDPAIDTGSPKIHYTYYDEVHNIVSAYLSDYYGIKNVKLYFGDPNNPLTEYLEMQEDYTGTGFYSVVVPMDYTWQDNEFIVAGNVRAYETEPPSPEYISSVPVVRLYSGPIDIAAKPLIRWVKLDHNELVLTAEILPSCDIPLTDVYLVLYESDEEDIELQRVADRNNIWSCRLPGGYHGPFYPELLIAVNQRGFSSSSRVTDRVNVAAAGEIDLVYFRVEEFRHTWEAPLVTGFDIETVSNTTSNPDWRLSCAFGPYDPWQEPFSTPSTGWWPSYESTTNVYWSPVTDINPPTVGLKISSEEWLEMNKSDLVLSYPVMYEDLVTQNVQAGDAMISYHDPYFLKAAVLSVTHDYVARVEGDNDHYDTDHTVTVRLVYVIFADE